MRWALRVILLDTTVLVYAVGEAHPLAESARRRTRQDATTLARAFSTLLSPLQLVGPQHLEAGLSLWAATPALGAFDSVLAALALSLDAELVSADRAFADVPGLRWQPLLKGDA